jgi:hypothetical protein
VHIPAVGLEGELALEVCGCARGFYNVLSNGVAHVATVPNPRVVSPVADLTFPIQIMPKRPSRLVVAVAHDHACTFELGIAIEVFGLDRPEVGAPPIGTASRSPV